MFPKTKCVRPAASLAALAQRKRKKPRARYARPLSIERFTCRDACGSPGLAALALRDSNAFSAATSPDALPQSTPTVNRTSPMHHVHLPAPWRVTSTEGRRMWTSLRSDYCVSGFARWQPLRGRSRCASLRSCHALRAGAGSPPPPTPRREYTTWGGRGLSPEVLCPPPPAIAQYGGIPREYTRAGMLAAPAPRHPSPKCCGGKHDAGCRDEPSLTTIG